MATWRPEVVEFRLPASPAHSEQVAVRAAALCAPRGARERLKPVPAQRCTLRVRLEPGTAAPRLRAAKTGTVRRLSTGKSCGVAQFRTEGHAGCADLCSKTRSVSSARRAPRDANADGTSARGGGESIYPILERKCD